MGCSTERKHIPQWIHRVSIEYGTLRPCCRSVYLSVSLYLCVFFCLSVCILLCVSPPDESFVRSFRVAVYVIVSDTMHWSSDADRQKDTQKERGRKGAT